MWQIEWVNSIGPLSYSPEQISNVYFNFPKHFKESDAMVHVCDPSTKEGLRPGIAVSLEPVWLT